MKREKFVKEVATMCGPLETDAIHQLAEMPPGARHDAARKQGEAACDEGLTEFLTALIDDNLLDEVAAILPKPAETDEADELLKRLWARLLVMISPEARDVLHAHNRLRLMAERTAKGAQGGPELEQGYHRALETARALLAGTTAHESREIVDGEE